MRKLVALVILMLGAASISGSNERVEKEGEKDINQSLDGLKNSLDSLKTMWNERD